MSKPDDVAAKDPTGVSESSHPAASVTPVADVESQTPETGNGGVSAIIRRWKREDLLKRGSLGLRGLTLLFSLISFIVMTGNKHGNWKDFDKYEEYRYLAAISILSTLYSGVQTLNGVHVLSTGRFSFSRRNFALLDFFGDQVVAYLLISSASAAIPLTNRMREGADNIFTDSSASAISMSVFAFIALALSAMISGFKLSNQTYI